MVETKRCPKCGQDKPLTAEHWKSRASRGWASPCRKCDNAHRREKYGAAPRTPRPSGTEMREAKAARLREQREQALAKDPEAYRAEQREKMAAYRERKKENARVAVLAVFADEYDRLQAGGMAREDALREAAKVVPMLRVKGA